MAKRKYPKDNEIMYINDSGFICNYSSEMINTDKKIEKILDGKMMIYPQNKNTSYEFIVDNDAILKNLSINKKVREDYGLIIFGPVIIRKKRG